MDKSQTKSEDSCGFERLESVEECAREIEDRLSVQEREGRLAEGNGYRW